MTVRVVPKLPRLRILLVACLVIGAACQAPGFASVSPAVVKSHDPGSVDCPGGKAPRPGLTNFGAYIGTWDGNHAHDPARAGAYVLGIVTGYVEVRCSGDGYVVGETIRPVFRSPEGQALRIALTDIPDDSEQVYDHLHSGCRVLQYRSGKLARQLGADDSSGRVDVVFSSDSGTYTASVQTILLDLFDELGKDTRSC